MIMIIVIRVRVVIRVFMMVWRRIKGIVQMILKEYWNEG